MPNMRTLILLSILVGVAAVAAIVSFDFTQLSAYGTIVGAAGGLLAVVWFTGSLWYQSLQLREQRAQFLAEFQQLREEGRRSALLLARDLLNSAESRALAINKEIKSLSDLVPLYMNFVEFKPILESDDPSVVRAAIESWLKKEGPAIALMKGLKSAAEVYFVAVGKNDIDYSKEPEEFIFVYGPLLWSLPFFEAFQSPATMLAEFMVKLEPGRKAVTLASFGVMVKMGGSRLLKMDSIREEIKKHVEMGYPLPKIVEGL